MNRVFAIFGVLAAVSVLAWFFPLFHVESRAALRAEKEQTVFHAADFVNKFWTAQLVPALADASDAAIVLAALREDPKLAGTQFGRTVGLGRSTLYFVRGNGTIVSVNKKQIGVSLAGAEKDADVELATGLLFGNTARDATGLLNAGDFPNSQQFNAHLVRAEPIDRNDRAAAAESTGQSRRRDRIRRLRRSDQCSARRTCRSKSCHWK